MSEIEDIVGAALLASSVSEFLDVDMAAVSLLETALGGNVGAGNRARLLARLARLLLGDASAKDRRKQLIAEATDLAEASGDEQLLAEVLDARLHAMWSADSLDERHALADSIVQRARRASDPGMERQGLLWRFTALVEMGRLADAESALAGFAALAALAHDQIGELVVVSRHAMLATLRGRFDESRGLIDDTQRLGQQIGAADTASLVGTLRGNLMLAVGREDPALAEAALDMLRASARRMPGHLYEATAARVLVYLGRIDEAELELDRVLGHALAVAGAGPRWLGAIADLAVVAHAARRADAAEGMLEVMLAFDGRLVVFGGANAVSGPVGRYVGLLEMVLGRHEDAVVHLTAALALEEQIGALPGAAVTAFALADVLDLRHEPGDAQRSGALRHRASSLASRLAMRLPERPLAPDPGPNRWSLVRDETDWVLVAGDERARLSDRRGLAHIAALVAAPLQEISALDLVAGGRGLVAATAQPVLDVTARRAYERRLAELSDELDAADRAGDAERGERVEKERRALVDEITSAAGLGGRTRRTSDDAERARVNVTRNVRAAIAAIARSAPRCAAHLDRCIRTGAWCRYQPDDQTLVWAVDARMNDR